MGRTRKTFCLVRGEYQPLESNQQGWLWSQQLQLFLGVHQSTLRFFSSEGQLVLTPSERAELAQQQAEAAQQQAEVAQQQVELERQQRELAQQRVEELLAKLKELEIDSDTEN